MEKSTCIPIHPVVDLTVILTVVRVSLVGESVDPGMSGSIAPCRPALCARGERSILGTLAQISLEGAQLKCFRVSCKGQLEPGKDVTEGRVVAALVSRLIYWLEFLLLRTPPLSIAIESFNHLPKTVSPLELEAELSCVNRRQLRPFSIT